jgi:hypothetical protein
VHIVDVGAVGDVLVGEVDDVDVGALEDGNACASRVAPLVDAEAPDAAEGIAMAATAATAVSAMAELH